MPGASQAPCSPGLLQGLPRRLTEALLSRFWGLVRLDDANAPLVAGQWSDCPERLCEAAGPWGASDPATFALLRHLLEAPEAGRPGPGQGEFRPSLSLPPELSQ